jgi:GDP-D-mannose dehydratase
VLPPGRWKKAAVSFETPGIYRDADALGMLRLLEAIRILGMEKHLRFYQASTSEMFGKVQEVPPNVVRLRDYSLSNSLSLPS